MDIEILFIIIIIIIITPRKTLRYPGVCRESLRKCPPFFINKEVPAGAVPQHIMDYLQRTGRARVASKKLLGTSAAEKMLVYALLLRWYLEHSAVVKAVYRTINYYVDIRLVRQAGD